MSLYSAPILSSQATRQDQENASAWQEYMAVQDSIQSSEQVRDFSQLLGEHAKFLINTAVHYGRKRQMELLEDAERLTDLHQEWAEKVTSRNDPREWKQAAKSAVRHHSHCSMGLIGAVASGGKHQAYHQARLQNATTVAADFHAKLDPSAAVVQNGDLHLMWARYGSFMSATLSALMTSGPTSTTFYRRASNCMKVAQGLGITLDQLKIR